MYSYEHRYLFPHLAIATSSSIFALTTLSWPVAFLFRSLSLLFRCSISFEVIGNERLESLWDIPSGEKLVIHRGRISINMNRQLCSDKVLKFIDNSVEIKGHNLTQAERHFITKANGDLMPCNVTKLNISVQGIRSRQAAVMWPRVKDNEGKLVTMLMMIKPTWVRSLNQRFFLFKYCPFVS